MLATENHGSGRYRNDPAARIPNHRPLGSGGGREPEQHPGHRIRSGAPTGTRTDSGCPCTVLDSNRPDSQAANLRGTNLKAPVSGRQEAIAGVDTLQASRTNSGRASTNHSPGIPPAGGFYVSRNLPGSVLFVKSAIFAAFLVFRLGSTVSSRLAGCCWPQPENAVEEKVRAGSVGVSRGWEAPCFARIVQSSGPSFPAGSALQALARRRSDSFSGVLVSFPACGKRADGPFSFPGPVA